MSYVSDPIQAESTQSTDELILQNMPLARSLARRYAGRGVSFEDLEQVAYLGLVKAVQRFEPDRGSLVPFAVITIRGELRRHFRDVGWVVRPTRAIQELRSRVTGATEELTQTLGHEPSPTDIAAHLDEPVETVREAMGARGCFAPQSLDAPVISDGTSDPEPLAARLSIDDAAFEHVEDRQVLRRAIASLTERHRMILGYRFFKGLTQREIGEILGISQMQVSRILIRILAQLREQLRDAAA